MEEKRGRDSATSLAGGRRRFGDWGGGVPRDLVRWRRRLLSGVGDLPTEGDIMTMQGPTETQLQQVLNMLVRRRRLILTAGVVGAALAATVGLLIPSKYTAKAQILIHSQQVSPITTGRAEAVDELAIETQVTMLSSRNHLRRVRDSLSAGLELPAAPSAAGATSGPAHTDAPHGSLATEVGTPSLEELEQNLKVYQERNSRVIAVTYTSTSPEKSAAIANQVARLYVETQADRKREEKTSAWVEQELAELNHQLSMAKSDFAARQTRLNALRDLQRREGGTDEFIKALDSEVLTELRRDQIALLQSKAELATSYYENHPEVQSVAAQLEQMRQKIAREVDRLMAQLESDTQIAGARARSLQQRLGTVQVAHREGREAELRLRAPQPTAAGNTQLYESLLRRQQQELSEHSEISPGMRILTVAEAPKLPSSPNPILFIFPALVVFSIGGGFLATVLEGLDRGLRSERDTKEALGIPCIGLVPQVSPPGKLRMHQYLLEKPFAAYTEAIRSVVIAALQPTAPTPAPKVFLVTSSVPGEGKTTLAVSFATYAARLQRRVLLVDLAVRDPGILRALEGRATRGVLDVLQGQPLAEVIEHLPESGLDYLPLPGKPIDPLALLGNSRLPDLLRQLRESYDCVVIDSAPLVGAAEARLLVSTVDKVLFAVKWGSTPREVAQYAVNLLGGPAPDDRDPAAFASAIITQVDLKKHAEYRYGDVVDTSTQGDSDFSRANQSSRTRSGLPPRRAAEAVQEPAGAIVREKPELASVPARRGSLLRAGEKLQGSHPV
jgi:polysaccharide biosynthesis transport protein